MGYTKSREQAAVERFAHMLVAKGCAVTVARGFAERTFAGEYTDAQLTTALGAEAVAVLHKLIDYVYGPANGPAKDAAFVQLPEEGV